MSERKTGFIASLKDFFNEVWPHWYIDLATYFFIGTAIFALKLGESGNLTTKWHFWLTAYALFVMGGAIVFSILRQATKTTIEQNKSSLKIEAAEERLRENPGEPQLAWDVAREKLESYLNRNLSQVRSIFMLTVFVMLVGFGLIAYGAYSAFHDTAHFNASLLTTASGVIVSFIGGTFLALYKSTMAQASEYVTILERINAVGMSVQILKALDDNKPLQQQEMAEIAKMLLQMYAAAPRKGLSKARTSKAEKAG